MLILPRNRLIRSLLVARACVAATVLAAVLTAEPAQAAQGLKVHINGQGRPWGAAVFLANGHTMVPIRPLLEDLGADLEWNSDARTMTARLGGRQLVLPIDGNQVVVDSINVPLPVPVQIVAQRAYVPVRTVAEGLGATVTWDGETHTVHMAWQGARSNQKMAQLAADLVGSPYRWGGSGPGGFDCSGLIAYVAKQAGIIVPRTASEQFAAGVEVSVPDLAPGDLVFFTTYAPGPSHVGVYVGHGQFAHAMNPGTGVTFSSLYSSYWQPRYLGARRFTETAPLSPVRG